MKNKDFNLKYDAYKDFLKLVGPVIGYGSDLECSIEDYYIDAVWRISDDQLTIIDGEDEYQFTISSYSAKGEQLFCGAINDLYLVMAYQDNWEMHNVYVLRKSNKLKD